MPRNKRMYQFIMTRHEILIEGLSLRGWGRGTLCIDEKKYGVEVRNALPGDRVLAELRRIEKNSFEAEVVEFVSHGYARVAERCRHAGCRRDKDTGCGGCTLQSIAYETQLDLKHTLLQRCLKSNHVEATPNPVLPCANQWFYRNKMELTFGPDGADQLGVGLHPAGFQHEVITLRQCETLSPLIAELCVRTTQWAQENGVTYYVFRKNSGFLRNLTFREGKRTGKNMVILTTSGEDNLPFGDGTKTAREIIDHYAAHVLCNLSHAIDTFYWTTIVTVKGCKTVQEDHLIFGPSVLREVMYVPDEAHALAFEILPHAFFQPNTLQAERLYDIVRRQAEPFMKPDTPVLDLYCGTGTIALSFARHGHRAIAVDIEVQAIENARANAEYNGLSDSVEFYDGDTAETLKQLLDRDAKFSEYLLVIDPPRRGLLPPAYKQIMRLGIDTIIYVSCNPESLANDLEKFLLDGYRIHNIQPVDMLPQTAHLETVVTLSRREKSFDV